MTKEEAEKHAERVYKMTDSHPALTLFLTLVQSEFRKENGEHVYWDLYKVMTYDLLGMHIEKFEALASTNSLREKLAAYENEIMELKNEVDSREVTILRLSGILKDNTTE